MGFSTFAVGLLPTFETVGWLAPVLLVSLRLLQGLALGGEYGAAATYVAEHSTDDRRGYETSWIQTTATLGIFLSLLVIGICRFSGVSTKEDTGADGPLRRTSRKGHGLRGAGFRCAGPGRSERGCAKTPASE